MTSVTRGRKGVSNDLAHPVVSGDSGRLEVRCDAIRAAAHELRTSLTAIRGFAEVLRMEGDRMEYAKREEMLDFIIDNAKAEEDVIERYLGDTPSGRGNGNRTVTLGLRDETRSLVTSVAPLMSHDQVHVDIPPGLRVVAERGALREVVSNLLMNAMKYSPLASPIEVTAALVSKEVRVTVRNAGAIAKSDLERIFDKGYRAESGVGEQGFGLGLGIVRELVTGMGGRIWAESMQGSTTLNFTLAAAPTMMDALPLFPFQRPALTRKTQSRT